MRYRGFTLIELLVVIAIIGILSAVVLASLSTARTKGSDAAIQSNLQTIQVQAEIFYSAANNYGTAQANCTATAGTLWNDSTVKSAVAAAQSSAGGSANVNCNSSASAYAISAKLASPSATTYYCIDSTGRAATTSTATLANPWCP